MTNQENDILYTEALQAANREALELDQEISQLHRLLLRLEARKAAVDDVCNALGRWVELADEGVEKDEDIHDAAFEGQGETIRLSEEEVSLIAYPGGRPEQAAR